MKKIAFIGLLYVMVFNASGQIGINTNTPDPSVVLQIYSTNKGILIPNMITDVRLGYGTSALTDGVIVYDAQMRNFFVWSNKKDDLRWKLINPWVLQKDVLGTGGNMILPDSIASLIEIQGKLAVSNNVDITGSLHIIKQNPLSTEGNLEVDGNLMVDGSITSVGNITVNKQSKFIGYGTIPIGGIIMWSGTLSNFDASGNGINTMEGWALCNGNNGTPNLSGRFIVSYGNNGENTYPMSQTGGLDNKTLVLSNIPSHNHLVQLMTSITGGHVHPYQVHQDATGTNSYCIKNAGAGDPFYNGGFTETHTTVGGSQVTNIIYNGGQGYDVGTNQFMAAGHHQHYINGNTSYAGSGSSFDSRPKYYALAFIMRTK